MADYDNNNKGAAFAPFDTQKLILQGKINADGFDYKVVFLKDKTRSEKNIIEVYEKIGTLFENDKKGNDAAPDYTGPFSEFKRLAAWRKMKDGKPYMTFAVSEQRSDQKTASNQSLDDDVIPF